MTASVFVRLTCDRCYAEYDGWEDEGVVFTRDRAMADQNWASRLKPKPGYLTTGGRTADLCGACAVELGKRPAEEATR